MFHCLHFIPADKKEFLQKAHKIKADVIIFDLEDGVGNKSIARKNLKQLLQGTYVHEY